MPIALQRLTGFERYRKTTRRAQLLAELDRVMPWSELVAAVATVRGALSRRAHSHPTAYAYFIAGLIEVELVKGLEMADSRSAAYEERNRIEL